jgi:hypothetical protein
MQSGPSDPTSESQPFTLDENVRWEHEWETAGSGSGSRVGEAGAQHGDVDHGDMCHGIRGMAYT